jgi:DNA-binding transcriptional ArsR family regulator
VVQYSAERAAVFSALGDPTRLALVEWLCRGEAAAQELAAPLAMSLTAVLKHIRVLESAGLVATRKDGRERRCRLVGGGLRESAAWLESRHALWQGRLDSLGSYLEEDEDNA